jgi:hypothetical protein
VLTDTITTPAAKVIQLYGLDNVSGPTKRISKGNEGFVKKHKHIGKIAGMTSWAGIYFGLAQLGITLSRSLTFLGKTLGDIIGFTSAFVHPSLVSMGIKKMTKQKKSDVGISRYLEADAISGIPASVAFFTTLNAVVYSCDSSLLSAGRAVSAALLSSITAFSVWATGFSVYWPKVVRNETGSVLKNYKEIIKGFISATNPWKHKTPENSFEEAGAIIGTSFFVGGVPWYIVRGVTSALVALGGIQPEEFTEVWISITSGLEGFGVVLGSVKLSIIEGIIKRRNKEL